MNRSRLTSAFLFIGGLLILTLGISLTIQSGLGIDVWLYLLNDWIEPGQPAGRLVCFASGLIVTGLGTALYLQAKFAPSPLDRLTLLLQKLTVRSIFFTRTLLYFVFLLTAFISGGPIGIGTLLTVCLGGFILHFFMPLTEKALNRISLEQPL